MSNAIVRPDHQMSLFTAIGYSEAAVTVGAACQLGFAEGLLKMTAPGPHLPDPWKREGA